MTYKISLLALVLLLNAAVYWFALKCHLLDRLGVLTDYDKKLLMLGISVPVILINWGIMSSIFIT